MATNRELLRRFVSLFQGSRRSYGQYDPNTAKHYANKSQYEEKHFVAHLRGEMGLGIVPILDDNTCWFSAIDIDAHGDAPDIDIEAIDAKIQELGLPVIPCRSKSGGVHGYTFYAEPLQAITANQASMKWAVDLGHPGVEIFPKQTKLIMSSGELQLGNWINLPYFNRRNTERYAVWKGQKLSFEEFLDLAESLRLGSRDVSQYFVSEHDEAPPCFQRMLAEGVQEGHRNEALFHAAVYLKRAYPDDFKDRARQFAIETLGDVLPDAERDKTIDSVARKDYKYKCNQEPCKSLCDREKCVTRKYGITPGGAGSPVDMPEISQIRKYVGESTRYELMVDGATVVVTGDEYLIYSMLRRKIMNALNRRIPSMKQDQFEALYLDQMMEIVEDVEVPEEATVSGLMRARLREWLQKAKETDDREPVTHGVPILTTINDQPVYIFRGGDFVEHLKRKKNEDLRGLNLWLALKELGLKNKLLRVSGAPVRVYVCPAENIESFADLEPEKFDMEF